jgi:hypothetical protein
VNGLEKALRISGRAVVIVGLAIIYGSLVLACSEALYIPHAVFRSGPIMAAAGCFLLLGVLFWPRSGKDRVLPEFILGLLCLPAGAILGFLLGFGPSDDGLLAGAMALTLRAVWIGGPAAEPREE